MLQIARLAHSTYNELENDFTCSCVASQEIRVEKKKKKQADQDPLGGLRLESSKKDRGAFHASCLLSGRKDMKLGGSFLVVYHSEIMLRKGPFGF